jgi:hypothetical protein
MLIIIVFSIVLLSLISIFNVKYVLPIAVGVGVVLGFAAWAGWIL